MRTTSAWLRRKRRSALSAAWRSSEAAEGVLAGLVEPGDRGRGAEEGEVGPHLGEPALEGRGLRRDVERERAPRLVEGALPRDVDAPQARQVDRGHGGERYSREPAGGGAQGLHQYWQRPKRSSQIPLLQERVAWQSTVFPSHGAPIGAPEGCVVPHDTPDTTLPSQKHGSLMVGPTMHTRGEHVTTPALELPLPSSFTP